MNCDWTKDNLVLYLYDELADDAKFELERHIQHCLACRQELESAREFKENMSELPVEEVSPNFLASSRMELQEALEHAEQARNGWSTFVFDLAGWMQQLKLAPALTAALLIIGFSGGVMTTYSVLPKQPFKGSEGSGPSLANIAAIDSVTPQANSDKVTIKYDTLSPQTLESTTSDPRVQQLLLLAARSTRNSDVQLDSIDILKSKPEDTAVREALVYALRYDRNPGV